MNVSLTQEWEQLVNEKVANGLYPSASEVVREGLRLLKERDEMQALRLQELRRDISIGLEQTQRGEVAPLDVEEIKAEGRRRLNEAAFVAAAAKK